MTDDERRAGQIYIFERISIAPITGCWLWQIAVSPLGYGRGTFKWSRDTLAHRASYQLFIGPIAPGLQVRHYTCHNPSCCNPAHLLVGTAKDNSDDKQRRRTAFPPRTSCLILWPEANGMGHATVAG